MRDRLKQWLGLDLDGTASSRGRIGVIVGLLGVTAAIYGLAFIGLPLLGNRLANAFATSTPSPTAIVATSTPTPSPTVTPSPSPTLTPTPSATPTITPTPTPALANHFSRKPIALMVENHFDARPQSGLSRADVVYEVVTEGFITRFLAIFGNHDADVVGPVRSTRHYFIALAAEYNAILGHAGASPQGYNAIRRTGLVTVDNNYGEGRYYRISEREAPHNLYTSVEDVRASADDTGEADLSAITFKSDAPVAPDQVIEALRVTYPDGYFVQYRYDRETNSYNRFMEGVPHVDAYYGEQYHPKNVVVQFVNIWPIPGDDAGRVDMELVGTGECYVFQDGRVIEGTWEKLSETGPTTYRDADGNAVRFNVGQTWIQIVHTTGTLRYE